MPELRTLVEHLVKTTVERSPSSPLDRQRELEATLERALAPLVAKQRELEAALAELRRTEVRPQAAPIAAKPRGAAIATTYEATGSWELPSELNGSRRKRVVIWMLAIGVILLLLSVTGLAVLSNMGKHF